MNTTNENIEEKTGNSLLGHMWASIASTLILTIICCGFYPLIIWAVAQGIFPNKANGSLVKKDGTPTTNPTEAAGSSLIGQSFSLAGYFHTRPSAAGSGYDPTSSSGSNYGPLSDKLLNGANNAATTQPSATQPSVVTIVTPETNAYDGIRLRTIHYAVDNSIPFKLFHAVYVKDKDGNYGLQRQDELPRASYLDAQGNLTMSDIALVDAFPHPIVSSEDFTRTVIIADEFAQRIPGDAVTASGSGLDPHISPENAEFQKGRVAAARNIKPEQVEELIAAHTDRPDLGILGDPGVNVLMLNLALDAKYPMPATQPTTAPVTK